MRDIQRRKTIAHRCSPLVDFVAAPEAPPANQSEISGLARARLDVAVAHFRGGAQRPAMINSAICGQVPCAMDAIVTNRLAILSTITVLGLCGCLGNSGGPTAPPTGVQTYSGDGAVSITWDDDPSIQYWVFFAQDPTLTTLNWTTLLFGGVLVNATSPAILCNQINNPSPTNLFPPIFFTVNGRTGGAPGGAGSALVSAAPRAAGGPLSPWIVGPSIPAPMTGLGYGAVTPCGYAGRPPSGIFVAVGPAGTIYSASVAPTVAGPLDSSQGNQTMTWIQGNVPPGFSQDLVAVAAYAGPPNPAAPVLIFVAVGANGTILRSVDGRNWEQISRVPSSNNLNAVAWGGSNFVAVGEGGVVLISPDGLNWTTSQQAAAASSSTLNAIRCVGADCVAVGTSGATIWTSNGGSDWTLYTHGANNWTGIVYGNDDANADPPVVNQSGGTLTVSRAAQAINTWVVVDSLGNYAYTSTAGGWTDGITPIASSVVAIEYTTRFVALDAAGNAYASENAVTWTSLGSSNLSSPTAMRSNGQGYVALDASGANASSF